MDSSRRAGSISREPAAERGVVIEFSSVLTQMQAEARARPYGDVRPEVVDAARADLLAGRIGTPEDLEQTLQALLGEL